MAELNARPAARLGVANIQREQGPRRRPADPSGHHRQT